MSASIILGSTSFDNNAVIPQQFKNSVECSGNNRSPEFNWTLYGIVQAHVESFNLYVENVNLPGSSTNGKFLHWGVRGITKVQQQISENGWWLDPSTLVLSTDYTSGDKVNGWNGPCADNPYLYRAWVEAKIAPQYAPFIWAEGAPADLILRSNYYLFLDRPTNMVDSPTTIDCNSSQCPPGYDLIGGVCQEVVTQASILHNIVYTPVPAHQLLAWGEYGTMFIRNANQYTFPIIGSINNTFSLKDSAGRSVASDLIGKAFLNNTHVGTIISNDNHDLWFPYLDRIKSRLNTTAIWTTNDDSGLPYNEWIGFTYCLNLNEVGNYCIGFAADNAMRFKINGNLIACWETKRTDTYDSIKIWYLFEIELKPGANIIEIECLNLSDFGGFGFEIYDASIDELEALTTPEELDLSGYVIFNSKDPAITHFDLGEYSGYSCPDGFSLSCDKLVCTKISKVDPVVVECCWVIESCLDSQERYYIRIVDSYPDVIYFDSVYTFTGNQIFVDSQTGKPKCFKVVDKVICDQGEPDAVDVEVLQYYGDNGCSICLTSVKFQRCDNAAIERVVTMQQNQPALTVGNIYRISADPTNCYIYLGDTTDEVTDNGVAIVNDFQTDNCGVCNGCLRIRNCNTDQDYLIKLAPGADNPDISEVGHIMRFVGHPDIDLRCWKFIGYEDCIDPDYTNILVDTIYDCEECGVCLQYYKLTDCSNPENILYIYWQEYGEFTRTEFQNQEITEVGSSRLESQSSYVFDFDETTCYTAERLYGLCEEMTAPTYNISNVIYEVNDCEQCNSLCYKFIDCETQEELFPQPQVGLGIYMGRTIRWTTVEDPDTIRCASVQPFRCLDSGELTETSWVLQPGCYEDCETCLAKESPVQSEFYIRKRTINPGSTIPSCGSDTNCNCY